MVYMNPIWQNVSHKPSYKPIIIQFTDARVKTRRQLLNELIWLFFSGISMTKSAPVYVLA